MSGPFSVTNLNAVNVWCTRALMGMCVPRNKTWMMSGPFSVINLNAVNVWCTRALMWMCVTRNMT